MLDAKPSADLDSVVPSEDDDELAGRPSDHATTTIGIVKDLAPGARVTSYSVLHTRKRADELGVVKALVQLRDSDVSVVVMPFKLEFGRSSHPKTWRTVIATLLPDLGPNRIVVAAAGNDPKNRRATFPGYMPTVVMVGAVEDDQGGLKLADYSAYKFDHPGPALHVVAPSGLGAIADVAVGTSGATAYAAGVIARTIAQCGLPNCADPARVLRRVIAEGANRSSPFDDVERCGAGLIREVTYDRDAVALQVEAGSVTGDGPVRRGVDVRDERSRAGLVCAQDPRASPGCLTPRQGAPASLAPTVADAGSPGRSPRRGHTLDARPPSATGA